jgi:hypothetical protein
MVFTIFFMYPTLTQLSFDVFSCTQLGPTKNDVYLLADLTVRCWDSSEHSVLVLLAIPILLIFTIGVPVGTIFVLQHGHHKVATIIQVLQSETATDSTNKVSPLAKGASSEAEFGLARESSVTPVYDLEKLARTSILLEDVEPITRLDTLSAVPQPSKTKASKGTSKGSSTSETVITTAESSTNVEQVLFTKRKTKTDANTKKTKNKKQKTNQQDTLDESENLLLQQIHERSPKSEVPEMDEKTMAFRQILAFLFYGYRAELSWWDSTMMLQKTVFIVIAVAFWNNPDVQISMGLLLLWITLSFQIEYRPYISKLLNRYAVFSICTTTLTFFCGQFTNDGANYLASLCGLLLNVVYIVVTAILMVWCVCKEKQKKLVLQHQQNVPGYLMN